MTHVYRRYLVATLAVVSVLILVFALYKLRWVALTAALAGLLAYFLAWPIERLSRRWPRPAAVWLVFLSFFILLIMLVGSVLPLLSRQIQDLISQLPAILARLETSAYDWRWQIMPGRELVFSDYFADAVDALEKQVPQILGNAMDFTQSFVTGTAAVLAAMLIIPLVALYLLLDSRRLRAALIGCFTKHWRSDVERALTAVNRSLGGYIYSRVLLALFVGVTCTLVLIIFGIDYALLLGLLAFAGEFIPVLGPWMAFFPTALIVLATDPMKIIVVVLFYLAIQLFENYWLAPRWMGGTMDLHPLTVIMAMIIGGTLGGIAGLFVAVPAAAALKVIMGVFVFRREEPGIDVPQLDLISSPAGAVDLQESSANDPADQD